MSIRTKLAQFTTAAAALLAVGATSPAQAQPSVPAYPVGVPTVDVGPVGEDGCPTSLRPAYTMIAEYYVRRAQPGGTGLKNRLLTTEIGLNNLNACAQALVLEANGGYNFVVGGCFNNETLQYDLLVGVSKATRYGKPKPSLVASWPSIPPGLASCIGISVRQCERLLEQNPPPVGPLPPLSPLPGDMSCPTVLAAPFVLLSQTYVRGPGVLQSTSPAADLTDCKQQMCDELNAVTEAGSFLSKNCVSADTGSGYEAFGFGDRPTRQGRTRDGDVFYSNALDLVGNHGCPPCVRVESRKCQASPLTP